MEGSRIFIMAAVLIVAMLAIFSRPSQVVGGLGWGNGAEIISLINYLPFRSQPNSIWSVNIGWQTVAEPSMMLLFGAGLIALAAWGKKQIRR
jgi:PEP-CTERM motif